MFVPRMEWNRGVWVPSILFCLYIDPLLNILSKSGYDWHIRRVYSGVLSYAEDITIICPSIWWFKWNVENVTNLQLKM